MLISYSVMILGAARLCAASDRAVGLDSRKMKSVFSPRYEYVGSSTGYKYCT
jgi:hypothetical protein